MEEQKKVIAAVVVFVAVAIVCVGIYYFFIVKRPDKTVQTQKIVAEKPALPEDVAIEDEVSVEPLDVALGESDDLVRKLVKEISGNSLLAEWLETEDIISKFVAAIDGIANGQTPRPQVDFFRPDGLFKVRKLGETYTVDPAGYERYDRVTEVLGTLDSRSLSRLYLQFQPAIEEAYKDLGYPETDFKTTLGKAVAELLAVPVIDGDIELEKDILVYKFADPRLEGLSPSQKHLLRMGPENVFEIQEKLRGLSQALGLSSS